MYGETMAILTNVSFAISFVLARKIENDATPIFQNAIRSIVGFITFLIICLSLGIFIQTFSLSIVIILILMMSILFTVIIGDTLYLQSQKMLGPAKALAISTTTPFFTLIFATLFLNRPFMIQMVFSIILIGVGVIIIAKRKYTGNFEKNINSLDSHKDDDQEGTKRKRFSKSIKGTILAAITAISWAIGIALTDYSISQVDLVLNLGILSTMIAMMVRFLFASLSLSVIALIENTKTPTPKKRNTWKILIISALLSYSIGSIFFGEAVHTAGATVMSIISTALPLFTIPFSYLINKESISQRDFVGIFITFLGVIIILI
ncbi:MAG: DMT family transporter [Candidatus Thorarchaeota archaeon]